MATSPSDNKNPDADLEAKIQTIVSFINGGGHRHNGSSSEPDVQPTAAESSPSDNKSSDAGLEAKIQTIVSFIDGGVDRRNALCKDSLKEALREVF